MRQQVVAAWSAHAVTGCTAMLRFRGLEGCAPTLEGMEESTDDQTTAPEPAWFGPLPHGSG
jgi:hypothetical protein